MNRSRSRSARRVPRVIRSTRQTQPIRTVSDTALDVGAEVVSPEINLEPAGARAFVFEDQDIAMAIPSCYVNYTSRAALHEYMQWYEVAQLMATLKNIWKINFSITEQRQQACCNLTT